MLGNNVQMHDMEIDVLKEQNESLKNNIILYKKDHKTNLNKLEYKIECQDLELFRQKWKYEDQKSSSEKKYLTLEKKFEE